MAGLGGRGAQTQVLRILLFLGLTAVAFWLMGGWLRRRSVVRAARYRQERLQKCKQRYTLEAWLLDGPAPG